MNSAQILCLATPAGLVAVMVFLFFTCSSYRFKDYGLTGRQKMLHALLGLMVGLGTEGLLFLVPDSGLGVELLLLGFFSLIYLLALIGGWICLPSKWRFVGFGLLAAAAIMPVMLLLRLSSLPPYTPLPFH